MKKLKCFVNKINTKEQQISKEKMKDIPLKEDTNFIERKLR